MCDICDKARGQPLKKALDILANALQQRKYRDRKCLDDAVGSLIGVRSTGQDALDCETVELKDRV